MLKRPMLLLILIFILSGIFPLPEAKAFDPVTLGILTPIAIKVTQYVTPYVLRGFSLAGANIVKMGKDFVDFFRLPLGLFQVTVLLPAGYLNDGILNLYTGILAPGKFVIRVLLLPVNLFGANVNL